MFKLFLLFFSLLFSVISFAEIKPNQIVTIGTSKFKIMRELGVGSIGVVYYAEKLDELEQDSHFQSENNKQFVAIKFVTNNNVNLTEEEKKVAIRKRNSFLSLKAKKEFLEQSESKEGSGLKLNESLIFFPEQLEIIDVSENESYFVQVLPLAELNMRAIKVQYLNRAKLPEKAIYLNKMILDILYQILFINHFQFIHTDIKPDNIAAKVHLGDLQFGLVDYDSLFKFKTAEEKNQGFFYTKAFLDPAAIGKNHTSLNSIYSFALVILSLLDDSKESYETNREHGNNQFNQEKFQKFIETLEIIVKKNYSTSPESLEKLMNVIQFLKAALQPNLQIRFNDLMRNSLVKQTQKKLKKRFHAEVLSCQQLF